MGQPPVRERPNPERRSDAAILCLCIGLGLIVLSWFLGVGGVMAAAFSGDALSAAAGGFAAAAVMLLAGCSGAILVVAGLIWLIVRVIADQREEHARERYSRDVER
jgi:hypothetical protein